MICVCGADCKDCFRFERECEGCKAIKGKVYWAQYVGEKVCPIYQCAEEKGYQTCGSCSQIPCERWILLKDPGMSEEEHLKSIADRVETLLHLR